MKKKLFVICLFAATVLGFVGNKKTNVELIIQDNTEALVQSIKDVFGEDGLEAYTTNMGKYVEIGSNRRGFKANTQGWAINDIPLCDMSHNPELSSYTGCCWALRWYK